MIVVFASVYLSESGLKELDWVLLSVGLVDGIVQLFEVLFKVGFDIFKSGDDVFAEGFE